MYIEHGKIIIREALAGDAEQLCAWWNDGKVMAHAGFPNGLGISTEEVKADIENDSSHGLHIIVHDGISIGEMNYRDAENDACEIGIKICDFSMQNKGLGKEILSLFIRALFDELGYKKIMLDTNLRNERAQHVYEQLGFEKMRINENAWEDQLGVWQSSVDYELTRERFISYIQD